MQDPGSRWRVSVYGAGSAAELSEADAVFEAMLEGWSRQQGTRSG
jgi:hypothetical protein